ncbi:MAG: alpha/beta fold hydrolase [Myxococcota bacterium]
MISHVLVHGGRGLPGSARDSRWMSHTLGQHARAIRIEMPGFGGTTLATGPSPSVESRGRFVVDCIDALALHQPILVGHSMGGVVATMAAILAPKRIAGLALLSSPGLRVHRGLRQFPRRRMSALLRVPGVPFALRKRRRR